MSASKEEKRDEGIQLREKKHEREREREVECGREV